MEEPEITNKNAIIVGGSRPEVRQKVEAEESRVNFDESNVVIGESKIRASKSRRRNIFDKTLNDNTSRVSQDIAESSISNLDDTRQRSKSQRRKLFDSR